MSPMTRWMAPGGAGVAARGSSRREMPRKHLGTVLGAALGTMRSRGRGTATRRGAPGMLQVCAAVAPVAVVRKVIRDQVATNGIEGTVRIGRLTLSRRIRGARCRGDPMVVTGRGPRRGPGMRGGRMATATAGRTWTARRSRCATAILGVVRLRASDGRTGRRRPPRLWPGDTTERATCLLVR